MSQTPMGRRLEWFVLFGAIVSAVVFYGLVAYSLAAGRSTAPDAAAEPVLSASLAYGIAGLALVASMLWIRFRMGRVTPEASTSPGTGTAAPPVVTPARFKFDSLVAMALLEVPALVGFVRVALGAPPSEYLPFGLVSLLALLAVVLPRGLAYWSAWEANEREATPGAIQ